MDKYLIGVSIGDRTSRSAISIIEATNSGIYTCRHLQCWQPGSTHKMILVDMLDKVDRVRGEAGNQVRVVIDITEIGTRAGLQFWTAATGKCSALMVSVAGYATATEPAWHWFVTKRELARAVSMLLDEDRIAFQERIRYAEIAPIALGNLGAEVNGGRYFEHDDIALAVGLPCWWAEHVRYTKLSNEHPAG